MRCALPVEIGEKDESTRAWCNAGYGWLQRRCAAGEEIIP
jgi:hypothetical protein